MNVLSHALIPVIASSFDVKRSRVESESSYWNAKRLTFLAVCGAAPDLLDPHLYLASRLSSWSHGVPALLGVALVLFSLSRAGKFGLETRLAAWGVSAYALHLCCDAISGGIAPLYPLSPVVIGAYYIPPVLWPMLDFGFLFIAYFLRFALPRWLATRARATGARHRGDCNSSGQG